jgi:uncharacterized protein (DUF2062 family)
MLDRLMYQLASASEQAVTFLWSYLTTGLALAFWVCAFVLSAAIAIFFMAYVRLWRTEFLESRRGRALWSFGK